MLFRAVDETLCQLSASKVALRAIHSKKHPTQSSKATPVKSGPSDSEEGGLLTPGTGTGGVYPRRRARSRGGSFGQQVSITGSAVATIIATSSNGDSNSDSNVQQCPAFGVPPHLIYR